MALMLLTGIWCENGHVVLVSTLRLLQRGPFPAAFARLRELRVLDLQENELSGEVPCELGQLTKLEVLQIGAQVLASPYRLIMCAHW